MIVDVSHEPWVNETISAALEVFLSRRRREFEDEALRVAETLDKLRNRLQDWKELNA